MGSGGILARGRAGQRSKGGTWSPVDKRDTLWVFPWGIRTKIL